jgi:hypothetical protein
LQACMSELQTFVNRLGHLCRVSVCLLGLNWSELGLASPHRLKED